MGVTEDELKSIKVPTVILPGNDKTHSRVRARYFAAQCDSGQRAASPADRGSGRARLIPFPDWASHEAEIAKTFADFMARTMATEGRFQARA